MLNVEKYMSLEDRKKQASDYLGTVVTIGIDRPIGTPHPKHNEILYPINYGYVPGVLGGDHEELDAYLLGVNEIVESYEVRIIGIIHRYDDVEDKLVGAPVDVSFTKEEIENMTNFQEQFYNIHVEVIDEYNFINVKEISNDISNDDQYYAENKFGDKYLVVESKDKPKEHFRDLEKRHLKNKDDLMPRLLHVIYRENVITSVYKWYA